MYQSGVEYGHAIPGKFSAKFVVNKPEFYIVFNHCSTKLHVIKTEEFNGA